EDVYALDQALPARYRRRSSWLAHRATYNAIRQFDTAGGAALWERLGAVVPALLVGRPAYESEAMESDPAATDDSDPGTDRSDSLLVFGDFSNYVIADRLGTTVEFIPHLFQQATAGSAAGMPTGQRGWYAYARVGADAVNPPAFCLLQAYGPSGYGRGIQRGAPRPSSYRTRKRTGGDLMAVTVYRCKQSFTTSVDGRRRSYSAGDLVLDDDPVNPARHPNFEEVSEYVRRTRPGVKRE